MTRCLPASGPPEATDEIVVTRTCTACLGTGHEQVRCCEGVHDTGVSCLVCSGTGEKDTPESVIRRWLLYTGGGMAEAAEKLIEELHRRLDAAQKAVLHE